jgi:general secretion pathway protein J
MKGIYRQQQIGFTLLELMVALSIFAVMSVMIFGGLTEVLEVRSATDKYTKRLTSLQLAFMHFSRDTRQLINRGVRGQFGNKLGALISNQVGQYKIELTKSGYSNPGKRNRSTMQRIAYGLDDNNLYRYRWLVLDRAADSEPARVLLLEDVTAFNLRFLESTKNTATGQGDNWVTAWPPSEDKTVLPKLVEVTFELEDWGRFTRIFELPEIL